jgi:hypothetical protein
MSEPQPKDQRIFPNENQSNKFTLFGVTFKSLKFSPQIIAEAQKSGKTIQRIFDMNILLKNLKNFSLFAIRNPINIPVMKGAKNCSIPRL